MPSGFSLFYTRVFTLSADCQPKPAAEWLVWLLTTATHEHGAELPSEARDEEEASECL